MDPGRKRMRRLQALYFDRTGNRRENRNGYRYFTQYRAFLKLVRDTTQKEKHT